MKELKVIAFMSKRKIATGLSIVLLIGSIISLFVNGLNLGLDFTGGTLMDFQYQSKASLDEIREVLEENGIEGATVLNFGADTSVRIKLQAFETTSGEHGGESIGVKILNMLEAKSEQPIELLRTDIIGAQIGEELRDDGGLGMLLALGVIMMYIAVRFQFKFSVGAVTALIHDVIIVLGFFSALQLDFDLTVLAAILAVIGYSLNDTIVVSDRIRENFRIVRKEDAEEVINISLSQTLGRTLITSLTTLLVLFALFFVGGELIHNFATALIIGIFVGTYSSIYVAANVLLMMKVSKEDLMPPEKEGEEFESLP